MPSIATPERQRREPPFSPVSKPPGSSPLHRQIGPRTRHDSRPWPPASRSFRTDAAIRGRGQTGDRYVRREAFHRAMEPRLSPISKPPGSSPLRRHRVLEGWCVQVARGQEAAPCVREAGGQGRLSCRARGPVAKVTTGFKGAGVSKEGPRSFVRPLFGRSTAKRSNEGVRGRSPRLRRRRSGLRPARVGRGRRGPTAPYLVQCPSRHSAERPRYFTFSSGVK
jgi:hypothetical protein